MYGAIFVHADRCKTVLLPTYIGVRYLLTFAAQFKPALSRTIAHCLQTIRSNGRRFLYAENQFARLSVKSDNCSLPPDGLCNNFGQRFARRTGKSSTSGGRTRLQETNLFPFRRRRFVAYTVPSWFMAVPGAATLTGAALVSPPNAATTPAVCGSIPGAHWPCTVFKNSVFANLPAALTGNALHSLHVPKCAFLLGFTPVSTQSSCS